MSVALLEFRMCHMCHSEKIEGLSIVYKGGILDMNFSHLHDLLSDEKMYSKCCILKVS